VVDVGKQGELLQIVLVGAAGLSVVDINEPVHCRWHFTVLAGLVFRQYPRFQSLPFR
jgi:hypothetical protein